MKCDLRTRYALHLLAIWTEGLSAEEFHKKAWPHKRLNATSILLNSLCRKGLVYAKYIPCLFKPNTQRPVKKFFLTEKGYTLHEFYIEDFDGEKDDYASYANRARGEGHA